MLLPQIKLRIPFGPLCYMRLANTAMLQETLSHSYRQHWAQLLGRWAVF